MPSLLQNERYKMLFMLSVLATLFATIKTDLVDLPLEIDGESAIIQATLTDSNGGNKYSIQEFISASGPATKGKIVVSGEMDDYNIHYNSAFNFNNERLVIHGTECLLFSYKNKWDQTLPGISNPVTNLVLLMGPSILNRLDHSSLIWGPVANKNIRGTMMKGATTEINKRLKITYYYKSHLHDDAGLEQASRIEFNGYDPSSTSSRIKENLILDIYLKNENSYDQLANEVQPTLGMGCKRYFVDRHISLPQLKADYVHFTMYEYIQGPTNTRTYSEIHASGRHNLMRVKTSLLGVTTEVVYDYNLGVSFLFEEGGSCGILPADSSSPGINSNGYFGLQSLFQVEVLAYFEYLGKVNLEHRYGYLVDVWEAVKYDTFINGKKVDKAVITQYFTYSKDSQIFNGYSLVSTKITTYKLDSAKKSYTLVDTITRDYMNIEIAGFEDELHDIFSLRQCKYLTSDKTLTLGFKFSCRGDSSSCTGLVEKNVYGMKKSAVNNVILRGLISALRIDNVQYNFDGDQIEIEVTFLDLPDLQYIFNSKSMFVSASTINMMRASISATDEYDCLDKLSEYRDNINVVIYRSSDSLCGYLDDFDDLEADTETGTQSIVFQFPLHNLQTIIKEKPLDQMQTYLLQNVGWSITFREGNERKEFTLSDIIDKTENKVASGDGLLFLVKSAVKLNTIDQVAFSVPDVKNFADCYRYCHNLEQIICQTFSFCENDGTFDCRVSSLLTDDLHNASHVEQDTKCSIFALNVLNDYTKVRNKRFKIQTATATQKSLDFCAESCHASPDCASFQYCDGSCSFNGFYSDAATEYDERCNVFYPKVSEKYQKTGRTIVSDAFLTEMNLNLDECASLCHGWSDGNTRCKSFNYCPKSRTESSCSLTQFSVKSRDTNTTDGGGCSNYELKVESNGKKSKESSFRNITKGTSGSGAFGIIMLFLFIGGALGFTAPFAYTKVKQMRYFSEDSKSFTWTKQVDAN